MKRSGELFCREDVAMNGDDEVTPGPDMNKLVQHDSERCPTIPYAQSRVTSLPFLRIAEA